MLVGGWVGGWVCERKRVCVHIYIGAGILRAVSAQHSSAGKKKNTEKSHLRDLK